MNFSNLRFAGWILLVTTVVSTLFGASCKRVASTGSQTADRFTVAFYNVENLFDTINDPKKNDDDFTPGGKLKWTQDRYAVKLSRIAEVIDSLPGELPAVIGLCEVENRKVLEDLLLDPRLAAGNYTIIHKDSPDERGIDVAMLYRSSIIKVENFRYTTVNLPDSADRFTRDLLYVKAEFNGSLIHLYANHWPSRGGGQEESESKRIAVANVLEMQVGQVLQSDSKANILLMGDFNDFPDNKSVAEVLKAGIGPSDRLFNYMYDDQQKGFGSYFYKGSWSPLDQFMGSRALHEGQNKLVAGDDAAHYFMNDLVLYPKGGEGEKKPSRTYVGDDYKGGYSDHLPIYISIAVK